MRTRCASCVSVMSTRSTSLRQRGGTGLERGFAIRFDCETVPADCETYLRQVFHRRRQLPDEPVGFRFAAEAFRRRKVTAVARPDFQVVIGRVTGGGADVGR